MIEIINSWQFNVVGFLISIVLFLQYYKLAVKDAKNDGAATILLQIIGGISILALVPFFSVKFPTDIKFYILLIVASVFYALNDRLQTTVRKHLEVSVYSILNMFKIFFLVLIGILFFNEDVVFIKIIGVLFVLLGNVILFYRKGAFKINKYAILGIVATFVISIAMSIDIGISSLFNLPIYISLTLLIPAIMLFLFEKQTFNNILREYSAGRRKYFLITGIFWGLTIMFTLRVYQLGEVSTVAPILASSILVNVIVAYIFLKERSHILKKVIAAIVVLIGVYLTIIA